jgi:ubiquitin-protein ligase
MMFVCLVVDWKMRLRKEFVRLQQDAPDGIEACPLESDILEWHYAVSGPSNTVYSGKWTCSSDGCINIAV